MGSGRPWRISLHDAVGLLEKSQMKPLVIFAVCGGDELGEVRNVSFVLLFDIRSCH